VDVGFTAKIEDEFDLIAKGKKDWHHVVERFYTPFDKNLEQKYEEVKEEEFVEETDEKCETCGSGMVVKHGRFGKFLACSKYPECKTTKSLKDPPEKIDMKCPTCKDGDVIIRRTKRGKVFFGCSVYPKCDFASWTDPRNPPEEKEKPEESKEDKNEDSKKE